MHADLQIMLATDSLGRQDERVKTADVTNRYQTIDGSIFSLVSSLFHTLTDASAVLKPVIIKERQRNLFCPTDPHVSKLCSKDIKSKSSLDIA